MPGDADRTDEQLREWYEEHERLRRWYVRQCQFMKHKLGRIFDGQIVYPNRTEDDKTRH